MLIRSFIPSVFALTLAFAMSIPVAADVTPADIFSDNMVLQRDKPVPVWGWAESGETVTVTFASQTKTVTAGTGGKWMVTLDPLKLSTEPQVLTLSGKNTVKIENILVGDVWICSGQSNMGRNVARSIVPEGMKWDHPLIRWRGADKYAKYPVERLENPTVWNICADEESTSGCVAVGFYFARRIQEDVKVPIGLLWAAHPGSIIQEWLPPHAWRLEPELKKIADEVDSFYPDTPHGRKVWQKRSSEIGEYMKEARKSLDAGTPFPRPQPLMPEPKDRDKCCFYNAKIHHLVPFALRGVLWYQGESDMNNKLWDIQLKAMARSWRDLFDTKGKGEDISFYWMQLQRSGDYCSPLVRQEQLNGLKLVPNSGMAVLLDLDVNVHPVNKVDSGIRMALLALNRDYDKKDIVPCGPIFKSYNVKGNKVIVEFDHADGGLRLGSKELLNPVQFEKGKELPNVELAGADGKWHAAKAVIEGERLVVSSDSVAKPVHVRYGYECIFPPPFLYNAAGLPAATFTTIKE